MKQIILTQGKFALVDDEDFEALNQFKWYAQKHRNTFYAARDIRVDGKQKKVMMHNVIMGGLGIDHADHDGLNNQRSNLRFATKSENGMNRKKTGKHVFNLQRRCVSQTDWQVDGIHKN